MFATANRKKQLAGVFLFAVILALFFVLNRFPKLDIVGEDLNAVTAPGVQCFQGFCIDREAGTSFLTKWWSFSVTYLRLVTVGMVFAFLVAGIAEAFLFPAGAGKWFQSGGTFSRTLKGAAAGPIMNLCSACIVPVSSAFHKRAGLAGAIAMVQGSATMNIPALAMVFFVFTPLLGMSRLLLAVVGALLIGPIVVATVRRERGPTLDVPTFLNLDEPEPEAPWGSSLREGFRDMARVSLGYLARMGPIMILAGFASGLAIQWLSPVTVTTYLGNHLIGIVIAATLGLMINVPLLFEIPLVALLLLLGMGTAPAATLLFTAAAGGPITFWGMAKLMPKKAIATFASATWSVGVLGGMMALAFLVFAGHDLGSPLRVAEAASTQAVGRWVVEPSPRPIFTDVTQSAGIDFLHHSPRSIIFPLGAGVVVFDYNGDDLHDIFLPDLRRPNFLYRNNGDSTFTDVAVAAGLDDPLAEANGGCAADYDNDGHQDLFVTIHGSNKLYRNTGDGTFLDVTAASLEDYDAKRRFTGCAWGDYDRDGDLDLIVVSHMAELVADVLKSRNFYIVLRGLTLYHNNGDGSFANVTALLGDTSGPRPGGVAGNVYGAGFQPVWGDFDNDGDLDLYVVNDLGGEIQPNVLWRNDGPGSRGEWRFTDISRSSGAEVRMDGMGLAMGDYDLDGYLDLFMTNVNDNVLLKNAGDGLRFTNVAAEAGAEIGLIGRRPRIAWGAMFLDYDNDGDEDLYVVSGFLDAPGAINSREQPNALLRNEGDGTFLDVSAGSEADDEGIGRGGAYLDFNKDGCLDIVVANYGQRAALLQNVCESGGHWLVVDTRGTTSNRDGIGARITVVAGGRSQIREVSAGSSSMGQNILEVHFGLGPAPLAESVIVRWPSGWVQTFADVAANQRLIVTEPQ